MNQDYQHEPIFMEAQPIKNAAYYRAEARKRLKPFWWTAILVTFLAVLLGGVSASFNLEWNQGEDTAQTDVHNAQEFAAALDAAMEEGDLFGFLFSIPAVAFGLILVAASLVTALALAIFVSPPVTVGYQRFALELADQNEKEIRVPTLFRFFKESYWKTIGLKLLHALIMLATSVPAIVCSIIGVISGVGALLALVAATNDYTLFTILGAVMTMFLWIGIGVLVSGLISIPVSYMYTFSYMIMAEYPTVGVVEALRSSRHLMKGHKWKLFCLDISFFGWYLLSSILTFGIGMLAVHPYNQAARAVFYSDIARRETAKETEFPSIDPNDYHV